MSIMLAHIKQYYASRPLDMNNVYGTAPFILASLEYEKAEAPQPVFR